ncbi:MAG: hypothetical protein JWM20_833 [Patescibacteria group bacterium]|nr:hypothetical protein [Patescibacteria group bacterium]
MNTLNVPFCKQTNGVSCGAACLVMIYEFYGMHSVTQEDILDKYKIQDPHNQGMRILTSDLVSDARLRGFTSSIIAADITDIKSSMALIKTFIKRGVPIITCQQYSQEKSLSGHFRVVIGIDEKDVIFHDPNDLLENGALQKMTHESFFELWQPTGENVTGGRFVWISNE